MWKKNHLLESRFLNELCRWREFLTAGAAFRFLSKRLKDQQQEVPNPHVHQAPEMRIKIVWSKEKRCRQMARFWVKYLRDNDSERNGFAHGYFSIICFGASSEKKKKYRSGSFKFETKPPIGFLQCNASGWRCPTTAMAILRRVFYCVLCPEHPVSTNGTQQTLETLPRTTPKPSTGFLTHIAM